MNEAKDFIEEIKEDFLYFLKENIRSYPICCDRATHILIPYIKEKFGIGQIKAGFFVEGENVNFHVWGQIDEEIIDFTYFQFLIDKQTIKKLSETKSANELYNLMVRNCYEDVLLKDEYKIKLQEKTTVNANERYGEIAKREKDFYSYLNHFKSQFS
jgi:hypothetical protein